MKKIKRIWKRFLLWIGATALTFGALTGCANKAEETSGLQLDMEQMLETAAQPSGGETAESGRAALREALGCPERYTSSFTDKSGKNRLLSTHRCICRMQKSCPLSAYFAAI